MADTPIEVRRAFSGNIDEHVALIHQQVRKSIRDGELRQLAVKIVSNTHEYRRDPATGRDEPYIKAYGRWFRAPPGPVCRARDAECELEKIWNFIVLNVRYVYDPTSIDTFATAEETLKAGGGDCDDLDILFESLLHSIGFTTRARVISIDPNPEEWVHVYPMCGFPKDGPSQWISLDTTVTGYTPGIEFGAIAKHRDYQFNG